MSAHTPGPWVVCTIGDGFEVEDFAGVCVAQAHQVASQNNPAHHEIRRANARLIAAAPELLDALRQWAWAEANGDDAELANARYSRDASIAKAEGR